MKVKFGTYHRKLKAGISKNDWCATLMASKQILPGKFIRYNSTTVQQKDLEQVDLYAR